MKSICNRTRGLRCIYVFLFCLYFSCSQQLKIFESRNQPHKKKKIIIKNGHRKYEKKFRTHEIPTRRILDPQSTHEKKFWTQEYPRENFGPTKYPRNIHEKKLQTHDITTRKILDPRNTHEKKIRTTTKKGTMAINPQDPPNLARSIHYYKRHHFRRKQVFVGFQRAILYDASNFFLTFA